VSSTDQQRSIAAAPSQHRVRVWAYQADEARLRSDVPETEISDLLATPHALVWIDVQNPTSQDLAQLQTECSLHPLAVEESLKHGHRPKIIEYATFYFMTMAAISFQPDSATVVADEIDIFLGDRFLITLHAQSAPHIEESIRRWSQYPAEIGPSTGALLHSLLDSLIDSYFPIADEIGDRVDAIQDAIFAQPDRSSLKALTNLRRTLLTFRRLLAPEREVFNTLLRRDRPILPADVLVYYHDIYDHVIRLIDTIDTYREMLSATLDVYLSATSNNLNEVMKVLAGWSIILMSATLVAGIYGMNFTYMPELNLPFGYPWALGLMLLVASLLYIYFRRRRWL
jgi:magnesium transporter